MSDEYMADPALEGDEQEGSQKSVTELQAELAKAQELANNYKIRAEKAEGKARDVAKGTDEKENELLQTVQELKQKVEARELDETFSKVASKVLSDNPEYKDVVDLNVIKQLHAGNDKTVEELIKETYSKFVTPERKGFEHTSGSPVEAVTSFAGMSGDKVKEAIQDPHAKAAYQKDVLDRMRKSF